MDNLTQKQTWSSPFLQKKVFSWFSERAWETSPLLLVARLEVWLNMHLYPYICLNILENAWINCSDYARALNMHDHLTVWQVFKMPQVLNKPAFWIWHGCICKGYAEFRICLIIAPYTSIMPEHASICLNIPRYVWTWLNIAECPWICPKMPE